MPPTIPPMTPAVKFEFEVDTIVCDVLETLEVMDVPVGLIVLDEPKPIVRLTKVVDGLNVPGTY